MRIGDLQYKEVINISNGSRLGYVSDIEFDIHSGKILSFGAWLQASRIISSHGIVSYEWATTPY